MIKYIFLTLFSSFIVTLASAQEQAHLIIKNNSTREMTIKIMRSSYTNSLHKEIYIGPYRESTILFSDSGRYFAKTKATLYGKEPVYRKGEPFDVVNDETGYSVMTLEYTIVESEQPQVLGGKKISAQEFESDN